VQRHGVVRAEASPDHSYPIHTPTVAPCRVLATSIAFAIATRTSRGSPKHATRLVFQPDPVGFRSERSATSFEGGQGFENRLGPQGMALSAWRASSSIVWSARRARSRFDRRPLERARVASPCSRGRRWLVPPVSSCPCALARRRRQRSAGLCARQRTRRFAASSLSPRALGTT
jgi:hypothetical protein